MHNKGVVLGTLNRQEEAIEAFNHAIKSKPDVYETWYHKGIALCKLKYHEKGRGNGYVITVDNKRIYISGDTEDIKEMRSLKDIDYAFVCMNLPYTMTVNQAASAVLEFKPKIVFPYHYRGKDGLSNVERFKNLVSMDKKIEVVLMDWYSK